MMNFDKAIFYFDQLKILATYTCQHLKKAVSFYEIALMCRFKKDYNESVTLLLKSLQYAWKAEDQDIQLLIYEELGKNFYYLGKPEEAAYFHYR